MARDDPGPPFASTALAPRAEVRRVGRVLTNWPRVCADEVPVELADALLASLREGRLELPLLPDVATKILVMARSPQVDGARLAEVLQRDQTLAGHVLRVANSAAHAARIPIVSLQQAISRLGLIALRDMVIAITVRGKVFQVAGCADLVQSMWVHALATACWAKEIARARRSNVESAFLCGLLHDIGYPVVLQAIMDTQRRTGMTYAREVLEQTMLQYHAVVGGALIADWKLPEAITDAILHHHDYGLLDEPTEIAMITHLADLLAEWMGAGHSAGQKRDDIAGCRVLEDLNIYPDDLEQLLALKPKVASLVAEMEN